MLSRSAGRGRGGRPDRPHAPHAPPTDELPPFPRFSRRAPRANGVRGERPDIAFDLELRNNLDGLVDVQPSHVGLLLGRGVYAPNLLAASRGANSLFRRGVGLRARARVTGTVTFTVSRRAARHLERDGNLQLLQFSDTSLAKASLTVGVFRTYR